jgi:hypothetical protein
VIGPDRYVSDVLPTPQQVRASHSTDFTKWRADRLAWLKAFRAKLAGN